MGKSLDGKVAIVTGAAQGIGLTYARALHAEGAEVVISDILEAHEAAASIDASGMSCCAIEADVSDDSDVKRLVANTVERFGAIDILVNNAALFASLELKPFEEISEQEWDAVSAVNIKSLFLCCKAAVPEMRKRGGGKIVNISSGTVVMGSPRMLHYVTSKAAVLGFTRSLARELGADNICVNALSPGFTLSEGVEGNPQYAPELRQFINAQRCFERDQKPQDLTGPLLYLVSSASDFQTGQNLLVDGGHYMY